MFSGEKFLLHITSLKFKVYVWNLKFEFYFCFAVCVCLWTESCDLWSIFNMVHLYYFLNSIYKKKCDNQFRKKEKERGECWGVWKLQITSNIFHSIFYTAMLSVILPSLFKKLSLISRKEKRKKATYVSTIYSPTRPLFSLGVFIR